MPTVGVVAKISHPLALDITKKTIEWLDARGCDWRLETETAKALKQSDSARILPREDLTKKCSPVVVLGGDGTLISVARHAASEPSVIIGVNLGTLGFLTEISIKQLFPTLEEVLAGKAQLEKRALLQTTVMRKDKVILSCHALNDIVITKEALARVFSLDLSVNGQFAATIRGDGVIIASPSGSTAYSLAAGGSIVHPQVAALLITPICPHSLTSRPLIVPSDSLISLSLNIQKGKPEQVNMTIDGQQGLELAADDIVLATTSPSFVKFAQSSTHNYFEILATKLKWAAR